MVIRRSQPNLIHLVIAVLILTGAFTQNSDAAEVITSFHARVEVAQNGELTVTETISVVAEGQEIKRGIFRDFPRTFLDKEGQSRRVSFDVVSIKRDGVNEPYHTVFVNSDTRVYIGEKDVYLPSGEYTYEIKYKTDRQIRYFDDHDEIYWNVTGNGWAFPINKASAEVILPDGKRFNHLDFFTGYAGETEKNAKADFSPNKGRAVFETTVPLQRKQGLTIVGTMSKGTINSPSDVQKFIWFMRDFGHIAIGALTLGSVLVYYLIAWVRVGRDPDGGVVVPRWDVPANLSPALINYVCNKEDLGKGWKALTAAIINLSVNGYLKIDGLYSEPVLSSTQKRQTTSLPAGEAAIMKFMDGREALTLNKGNSKAVSSIRNKFMSAVENENRKAFYKHNTMWVVLGIILSVFGVLSSLFFNLAGVFTLMIVVIFGALFGGLMVPLYFAANAAFKAKDRALKVGGILAVGAASCGLLYGAVWVVGEFLNDPATYRHLPFVASLLGIIAVNVLFFFLMGAPTKLGAQTGSIIDGLRLYINFAEKDRMALAGAPQMSALHFEKILPYAVALGIEKQWSASFENWLKSSSRANAERGYRPSWSNDDFMSDSRIGERLGSIGTTMSNSFSASIPVSSSSSGSSSGSSGGGGGGGGGGGW